MLKTSLAIAAALTIGAAPLAAQVAEDPAPTESEATAPAATTPDGDAADAAASTEAEDTRTFSPVNFNVNEDLENILLLDLSNGQRVAIRLKPDWAPHPLREILRRHGSELPGGLRHGISLYGTGLWFLLASLPEPDHDHPRREGHSTRHFCLLTVCP